MVRLARTYVPTAADAEEVAQEAWLGVITGLQRFEGRSSLTTWIFRILVHKAMSPGKRERRTVPFSAAAGSDDELVEPSVAPDRFLGSASALPGHWAHPPQPWDAPDQHLVSSETMALIGSTINTLPPLQRRVITLRDVEGWTSAEVCELLALSESNQRVLLHRGRSKVRLALERYVSGGEPGNAGG
jgi:RNA polymerase sigma-70 factor (ECF subfamily)